MALFSFGRSKASQSSVSNSFDASLSQSASDSFSQGGSAARAGSTQSIAFEQLFAQLFGNASNAATVAATSAPGLQDVAGRLFMGGTDFLTQLAEGGAGTDYLAARLTGPDAAAGASLESLQQGLAQLFSEDLLPAITRQGVETGTLGGSREAVSIGRAAGEVGRQYSVGAADILTRSQAQRDAAAGQLGALEQGGAVAGLSALDSLYNLSAQGAGAGLAPYLALSQILGSPTVLTEQSSESSSFDVAQAISRALASSVGGSSSRSTGKSSSFNFGFSPTPAVG